MLKPQCCLFNPKTVRPEPVEGLPFDRLRANGAKWISHIEQYWAKSLIVLAALALPAVAAPLPDFDDWLSGFRQQALQQGIRAETLSAALDDIKPLARVVELDRRQPEFLQTFAEYQSRRLTPDQIARGQALLTEHAALLGAVEARYGVPPSVLVAFWGLETNYGRTTGNFNIPASLATLAWEGRRSDFFRSQLLDALRILDAGHVTADAMQGSWAGAMGNLQFMPSTFRAYALDADGDQRIDLWNSLPDALHSAGHYLQRAGWQAGAPVALAVQLPAGFDWRRARYAHRLDTQAWSAQGVRLADGSALPTRGRAAIILPQGWQGPAFMVFDNFDVVMQWNRSVNYALSVASLAERLAGAAAPGVATGESGALSTAQLTAMQQALNELGFPAGAADGFMGPRTQTALRLYQVKHGLPADGYPAPTVFAHIEQTHASAANAGKLSRAPEPVFADPTMP